LFFRDRVSLYSPGCSGAHFVDQGGLELRNPPASASQVLGGYATAWQIQKWMLTVLYWMEHRAPNGGARESA
jgi:hypothetical protein